MLLLGQVLLRRTPAGKLSTTRFQWIGRDIVWQQQTALAQLGGEEDRQKGKAAARGTRAGVRVVT